MGALAEIAALLSEAETDKPANLPLTAAQARSEITAPADPALEFYRSIMTPWRDDPKIKAEFKTFGAWSAFQERQFAAKHGLTVEQVNELYPNHAAEAERMIEAGVPMGTAKADAVRFADEWRVSAAIRAEFRRFEVYCAYMRGRSRIAGRGSK